MHSNSDIRRHDTPWTDDCARPHCNVRAKNDRGMKYCINRREVVVMCPVDQKHLHKRIAHSHEKRMIILIWHPSPNGQRSLSLRLRVHKLRVVDKAHNIVTSLMAPHPRLFRKASSSQQNDTHPKHSFNTCLTLSACSSVASLGKAINRFKSG